MIGTWTADFAFCLAGSLLVPLLEGEELSALACDCFCRQILAAIGSSGFADIAWQEPAFAFDQMSWLYMAAFHIGRRRPVTRRFARNRSPNKVRFVFLNDYLGAI
jgi:hypothetical protein